MDFNTFIWNGRSTVDFIQKIYRFQALQLFCILIYLTSVGSFYHLSAIEQLQTQQQSVIINGTEYRNLWHRLSPYTVAINLFFKNSLTLFFYQLCPFDTEWNIPVFLRSGRCKKTVRETQEPWLTCQLRFEYIFYNAL